MQVRALEYVNSYPVEVYGPETEIVVDNTYVLKFYIELIPPIPVISAIMGYLIQWRNKGEELLKEYLDRYGCYAEVISRDSWIEWSAPLTAKRVWFKYEFVARPKTGTGAMYIPPIALIPLIKWILAALLIIIAGVIAFVSIKIGVYLSKSVPILSWLAVGFAIFVGFYIVKEVIGIFKD